MSITKMELFYSNSCPACRNFKPVWNKLKEDMGSNNIQYTELNCQDNMEGCKLNNVTTIPHVEVYLSNNQHFKYTNSREYPDLRDFILSKNSVQQGGNLLNNKKSTRYPIKYIN